MTPALTMVMQRYLPNQMLNDERAAEATMIARIADTAAVNVSLNHLRMKNSPAIAFGDISAIWCCAVAQSCPRVQDDGTVSTFQNSERFYLLSNQVVVESSFQLSSQSNPLLSM